MNRHARVVAGWLATVAVGVGHAAWTGAGADGGEVTLPLVFESCEGGDASSGWLRTHARYVQEPGAALWIEAEQASQLVFQTKAFENPDHAFPGEDAGAGAGRYIAFVERAQYDLDIVTPATFHVWYRALFPWQGGWNHRECMVGQPELSSVTDCNAGEKDTGYWRWVKGPGYTLTAGRHTWELSYHGGARLDRMVLTPDAEWTPAEGEIGLPATVTAPARCVAVTRPVRPRRLARWGELRARTNPGSGAIQTEVSTDGGKSYAPLAGTDLSTLPVRGDGEDTLVFRFTLTPGPDGHSPAVQSAQISYRGAAAAVANLGGLPDEVVHRLASVPLLPMRGVAAASVGSPDGPPATVTPGGMAFAADADGRFWLEAEMATLLRAYPDNGAATAVDGSVGTALYMIPVRPHVAVYDVQVPRDAAYTVAFRVRRARPAAKPSPSADCSLRVDAGPLLRATLDLKGLDADGWGWVRTALSFPLGAGLHRVEWLGGMTDLWVDRLCLCPEALATPEQTGAPAAAIQRVDDAVVEFFPVFPPRGASWDGLEGLPAATTEVSLDGGKTWTAPPANLGDGELRVRTRLTGPANPGVRLKAPAPLLRLADGAQELWFEPEGGLYGLFHRGRGEWVVPPGTRSPAFSLAYQLPGMARLFGLDPEPGAGVTVRAGERSLSWVTELMDGGLAVTTTVEVGARHPGGIEDTAAWRIEVANRSDIEIRHVDFPKIQRVALGGIRADDRMLYPEAFGAPLDQPYTQAAYSYNPLIWPGTASMAWLDLADEGGGLYLAARHPDGLGVEFDTGADPDLSAVRMSFKKQICIGPGETWAGDYTTWAHPGDWHAAADAYRAWADSWMKRPAHPEWMQMCDGYGGLGGANGRFYSRYVTHALPVYQWLGVNYVQQWGMSADGEFCGLTLWMNPRYGSADDLRSSHDAMRKAGVHHTYYINSQGWFPGFSTLAKVGHIDKRWLPDDFQERPPEFFDEVGLRNFGGMLTQYGAGVNYTDSDRLMCAASRGWHDRFMTELAGRGIRDLYRSDGAYIDQMGCTFHYCHGEGHGHGKQHAASGRGYAEIARDVLAAGRRRNPDCVLGVEGITDLLAQYVNWGLWVTRPSYRGEVFLYTRPEAILFRGRANGHSGAFPSWGDCMADVFLYNRFDPIPEDADSARILRLRRRVADWMYRGRFMDERGLSVRGAPLDARWFRCNGRGREGAVINVHNWTERPGGRVGLDGSQVGGTVAAAILYTDDDRAAVVTPVVESGRVWVEVPANRNSAILLSSRVPERGGLRSYARWPGDAGPNRIEVTLVNPSPRAQSARLVLERAADLGAPDRRQTVEVPARGVTVAVVPLGDRRLGRAMTTARVRVSAGGDRERVEAVVPPVLVNGDFETDSNRDGVPDGWGTWNIMVEHQFNRFVQDVNLQEDLDGKACPERPFNGKACLKLPRAFDYQGKQLGPPFGMTKLHYAPCSQQAVYLRPGMRCRLKVLARTDPGNKGTVSVSVVGVTLADRDLAAWGDQWKTFEKEFDVPPTAGVLNYLTLTADTSEPVYFDAVSLEELGPTTAKP